MDARHHENEMEQGGPITWEYQHAVPFKLSQKCSWFDLNEGVSLT